MAYRERLIDEVKKYPVLYDARHEHHRDIEARDRCWSEIAARLDANSEVLKREWKILRDSLRQVVKKARGGALTKRGAPCKKWRYEARMAFLLPHMTRRSQQAAASRDDMKLDVEVDSADVASEWRSAAASVTGGGGAAGAADALELFFASVCCSARRLPPPLQRGLKRSVLDALHRAEACADQGGDAGTDADSKPVIYDDF